LIPLGATPSNPRPTQIQARRYEYATREVAHVPGQSSDEIDRDMVAAGFKRIYADVDMSGEFIVYRRPRVGLEG